MSFLETALAGSDRDHMRRGIDIVAFGGRQWRRPFEGVLLVLENRGSGKGAGARLLAGVGQPAAARLSLSRAPAA